MGIYKRLSPKLLRCSDLFGRPDLPIVTYGHYCPACDELHHFFVEQATSKGARWTFDGDLSKPTFSPSMNIEVGPMPPDSGRAGQVDRCHYFLQGGRVQYLGDCTHDMAGTTVDLQDVPSSALEWMQESV